MAEPNTSNQTGEDDVVKTVYDSVRNSTVAKMPEPKATFKPTDKVSMLVTQSDRSQCSEDFVVEDKKLRGSTWTYQLKRKDDGTLQDGGAFFSQGLLSFAE